jgi:4-deoxy-L-threo-5-hexosulose-uronate ketol-isomerase
MEIRQPIHSDHVKTLDTEPACAGIFWSTACSSRPGHADLQPDRPHHRGWHHPVTQAVRFSPELGRHTGTDFFLQRRELGLINIGGAARVVADGRGV